jgi:hypothetical protein
MRPAILRNLIAQPLYDHGTFNIMKKYIEKDLLQQCRENSVSISADTVWNDDCMLKEDV